MQMSFLEDDTPANPLAAFPAEVQARLAGFYRGWERDPWPLRGFEAYMRASGDLEPLGLLDELLGAGLVERDGIAFRMTW